RTGRSATRPSPPRPVSRPSAPTSTRASAACCGTCCPTSTCPTPDPNAPTPTRRLQENPMTESTTRPSALFVCVHNAGRSQMAAGYLRALSGGAVEVRSAGSAPADQINPTAVEAMLEEGIDIRAEQPKVLTP